MRAASAQIGFHMRADLCLGGRRLPIKQGLRAHDHTGDAVAALRRLLVDEGLLQSPRLLRCAKPLDSRDVAILQRDYGRQAGVDGLAVNDNRAGAALPHAAAELRAVQAELAP